MLRAHILTLDIALGLRPWQYWESRGKCLVAWFVSRLVPLWMDFGPQGRISRSLPPFMKGRLQSSKTLVRNHQGPPSRILRTGYSWHNFIHARKLNICTQLRNVTIPSWREGGTGKSFPWLEISPEAAGRGQYWESGKGFPGQPPDLNDGTDILHTGGGA